MKIEWTSYHSDGTPRQRPLASSMHGWLTKMRGTLLDDEKTRWRGIKEMKEARAIRQWKRDRQARQASNRGPIGRLLSMFGRKPKQTPQRRGTQTVHRSQSRAVVRQKTQQSQRPPAKARGHSNVRSGSRGGGTRPTNSRHNTSSSRPARVRR